ncbi:protein kinase domain-containing protein [Streptomyces meridianus]|uniref:non-specific serine/threonine protein kinase n=1 Tax=Streptomyces meridianus TaxID=2938945 RepID=A0ABT0X596_9ACTN|nr:protein kinase [Streptomyces meridianus]MCM2577083.1 protein kinase [Streptomyces meridianus]
MTAPQDIRLPGWSPTGLLAGRYELGELLGSGGAAEVFRGTDRRLGRPVAVKVFRPGVGRGMEDRFEDEALLLARLEHAGLVTVYDIGRHEGRSFLVMQLVEGRTLRQYAAGTAMDPHRVAEIGAALAGTLAHVHAADVMHCDVKPSNILLDGAGRPYLTDFGISRPVDATASTNGGALVGTAAYLAPEQVKGERVEQPADIYALGLVLLECLKGELEYAGTPLESAVARLHRLPVIPGGLPPELDRLLREMTDPDPWARPCAPDCAQRLEDLLDTIRPGLCPPVGEQQADGGSRAGLVAPVALSAAVVGSGDTRHDGLPGPTAAGRRRRGGVLAATGAAVAMTVLGVTLSAADPAGGSGAAVRQPAPSRSGETSVPASPERDPELPEAAGTRTTPGRGAADRGPRPAAEDVRTGKKPRHVREAGPGKAPGPRKEHRPGKEHGPGKADRPGKAAKGSGGRGPA